MSELYWSSTLVLVKFPGLVPLWAYPKTGNRHGGPRRPFLNRRWRRYAPAYRGTPDTYSAGSDFICGRWPLSSSLLWSCNLPEMVTAGNQPGVIPFVPGHLLPLIYHQLCGSGRSVTEY
ncbi:hypothetical protein KCP74_18865 [Salmonella enterica subsp. enterica]|nr:hypothetical protein KCP74_18865 [Salmonella enterica subsp. enterica]